eukprot:1711552-Pyramimonas_sp.AAC.1
MPARSTRRRAHLQHLHLDARPLVIEVMRAWLLSSAMESAGAHHERTPSQRSHRAVRPEVASRVEHQAEVYLHIL